MIIHAVHTVIVTLNNLQIVPDDGMEILYLFVRQRTIDSPFSDAATGEARRGFIDVVTELEQRFPNPEDIVKEADKKAFAKLFGEYLRVENILQNYDEFASLKALQGIDMNDKEAVEAFKAKHYLTDDDLAALKAIKISVI